MLGKPFKEQALQAHAEREDEKLREQREKSEAEAREFEARFRRAEETLIDSPLYEWFPHVNFTVQGFTRLGVWPGAVGLDGRDCLVSPDDHSVTLLLQYDRATNGTTWTPPRVYAVEYKVDENSGGYEYYDGPEVKSAADIGAFIASREK